MAHEDIQDLCGRREKEIRDFLNDLDTKKTAIHIQLEDMEKSRRVAEHELELVVRARQVLEDNPNKPMSAKEATAAVDPSYMGMGISVQDSMPRRY